MSVFKEKRRSSRSRVFFGGDISLGAQLPTVECLIKNISFGGASVVVQSDELIPDRFDLLVRKTGERHYAVVKRSNGRQLGLAYVSPTRADRKWTSVSELRKIAAGV